MRPANDTVVPGVHAGRSREWISVTTVAVPTVWLATADGLVLLDLLAIELAVNGLRTDGWRLTGPEAAYAADRDRLPDSPQLVPHGRNAPGGGPAANRKPVRASGRGADGPAEKPVRHVLRRSAAQPT